MGVVISVDMQGQGPMDFSSIEWAGGPHAGRIDSISEESNPKSGKTSLRFRVTDMEEGSATRGVQNIIVIGTDWSKKGNRGHLANLLVGIGAPADRLKGMVTVPEEQIVGKTCYFFVKPPAEGELDEEGRQPFASKNFVTKEMYESAKRAMEAMGGAALNPSRATKANGAAVTANANANANGAAHATPTSTAPAPAPATPTDPGLVNLFG